eukprot:INCI16358.4.p1 GENE.INCI16358.4~~INCI16358.4.p1  ORF type:complete len:421 (-),score=54.42 INCI16358.4:580-1842(-)
MSEGMRKPLQARRGSLMRTASIVVFGSGGSTRSSVVTMVQSTLGAGVLTLPFALSQAGIVIGLELLLAACTLNFMAGWAIARASQETRMSSFSGLSALISKNHAVIIFLDIATIVLVLGIVSSCLFVFGDSLEDMLQGVDVGDSVALRYLTNRNVMIGAVTFVAVLPVASIKKVDSLRFVSTLALLLQLLVCAYVMFIGATNLAASGTVALTVRLNREPSMDTIHAFSCFIFAFCNQIQLPYVVEKMQNSERDLMPTLMWSSVLLFVFNCLFSLAGWLAVGSGEVNGDILRNLPVGTVVRDAVLVTADARFASDWFRVACHSCLACANVVDMNGSGGELGERSANGVPNVSISLIDVASAQHHRKTPGRVQKIKGRFQRQHKLRYQPRQHGRRQNPLARAGIVVGRSVVRQTAIGRGDMQ